MMFLRLQREINKIEANNHDLLRFGGTLDLSQVKSVPLSQGY